MLGLRQLSEIDSSRAWTCLLWGPYLDEPSAALDSRMLSACRRGG